MPYEFKGTQGNWKAGNCPIPDTIEVTADFLVVENKEECVAILGNPDKHSVIPNAHLIASAPDLLQAAIEVVMLQEGPDDYEEYFFNMEHVIIPKLKAAIHKALNIP